MIIAVMNEEKKAVKRKKQKKRRKEKYIKKKEIEDRKDRNRNKERKKIVRRGMHTGYWWESQKDKDHWEEQDVGGWTILKWISERCVEMVWIALIWLRIGTSGGLL
jgi:hypothetical protein